VSVCYEVTQGGRLAETVALAVAMPSSLPAGCPPPPRVPVRGTGECISVTPAPSPVLAALSVLEDARILSRQALQHPIDRPDRSAAAHFALR